ncbi:MAG TPA: ABC transporter substrate-binding protein, partial [Acidimicrobiia bacterium]|nr:ABC transporter substrate-binding protein [Acidimicrobiia bacterium]
LVSEDERESFTNALVEAIEHRSSRVRVVITLRADFYDHPLASRQLGELLRDHTELVTPMSAVELEHAITQPAESAGVVVEPALLAALTAEATSEPAVLPMLQYTLTELFERRSGKTMTLESFDSIGGLTGAVVGRAEALFAALSSEGRSVARHVFLRLVSINDVGSDTRRRALLSELQGLGGRDGDVDELLRAFARHRLLSFDRDPVSRAPTVEVAHESLIGAWSRLGSWIDRAREDVRAQRRLATAATEWIGQDRNPDFLLTGASLARYATWVSDSPVRLTADERAFLEAAFAQDRLREIEAHEGSIRESRLRRRTRALVGLGALSLLVVLLAVVAFTQRERAEGLATELASRDRARALIAESGLVVKDDPALGMLLAIEAMRVTESGGEVLPEAVDAVHWALQEATVLYPADDADIPVAVRPHATGPRGVFALSPAELADHGRAALGRPFTSTECERFFSSLPCPDTSQPIPADVTIAGGLEGYTLVGEGLPLEGTLVELTSGWSEEMVEAASDDLAALGADMGVEVAFRWDGGLQTPGDIIAPGLPRMIFEMASERPVVDIGSYIGEDYLRESYGEHLMSLVSRDGSSYGIPMALDPKSLIFYNPEAFAEAGYTKPASWDELITLSDRMVSDGRTPWCLGVFSFDDTGWLATDWLETIVLQSEGPEFYDQWASHQVPFDHPAVVGALEKIGQLAHTTGYHPPGSVGETSWDTAMKMVSEDPPRCLMAPVSDFGSGFFGEAPRTVMLFPAVNPEYTQAMEGGVGIVYTISDRPEVRAVMRGFASASWGTSNARNPNGWFYPSHVGFDVAEPTDPIERIKVSALTAANQAGLFRFDASDNMPGEIGFGVLFDVLTEYVSDPELSAKEALAQVEAAWKELEETEALETFETDETSS